MMMLRTTSLIAGRIPSASPFLAAIGFNSSALLQQNRRNAAITSTQNAFNNGDSGGGESMTRRPLGDQKTIFTKHMSSKFKRGGDRAFVKVNYEERAGTISGFGSTAYRNTRVSGYSGGRDRNYGAGADLRPAEFLSSANMEPIFKELYQEHANVTQRSQKEISEWMSEHQVHSYGNNIPRPVYTIEEANFPKPITDVLVSSFKDPTVIQSLSWPAALSGRDMISVARTGSGKTLGYILPAIIHTLNQPTRQPHEGPTVLVLLPTRELAQQVEEVAREFCTLSNLKTVCCYGGASKTTQARALSRGVDICIATPGRILDFIQEHSTSMRRCTFLVLDEADRMLDMGFEPQIRRVVSQIRSDRQTMMFSATWPEDVRELASEFLNDPIFFNVGSTELAANANITQRVEIIDEFKKEERLVELLSEISAEPILNW